MKKRKITKKLFAMLSILVLTACSAKTEVDTNTNVIENVTAETVTTQETTTAAESTVSENLLTSSETVTVQEPFTVDTVYTLLNNTVDSIPNGEVTEDAKAAFIQYLTEQDYLYGITFADTNADGNAEMIVSINQYGLTDIVYYAADSVNVVHVDTASDRGLTRFLTGTDGKMLVLNRYDYGNHTTDMGSQLWYIYTVDETSNNLAISVEYNRMCYDGFVEDIANADKYYGDAYLNGQLLTEQQSNELLTYLNSVGATITTNNSVPAY